MVGLFSMKNLSKLISFITMLVISLSFMSNSEASAASDGLEIDISALNTEMQCAAAANGVEYAGALYFTDGTLYHYDKDMADQGKNPKKIKKGVRKFFIEDNYIFYWKPWSNSLYRMELDGKNSVLISKGVRYVLSADREKIYFWGKKYLYEMNHDGSDVKRIFTNKGNRSSSVQMNDTAYIFDGKMLYSKAVKINGCDYSQYWSCDHKVCMLDLNSGEKETLISPKGLDETFSFSEINGELYAISGKSVYKYNPESETFSKLENGIQKGRYNIGEADGTLYSTDDWLVIYDDGTYDYDDPESWKSLEAHWKDSLWTVYRIDEDWEYNDLFTINDIKYDYESVLELVSTDGKYYCFTLFLNEPLVFCTDSDGNIVYKCYIWRESDSLYRYIRIKDGVLYILCFNDEKADLAKIVDL